MSLFEHGSFLLHSGQTSDWRINCDDLTETDIEVLAQLIYERAEPFMQVKCPPSHRGSAANKLVQAIAARAPRHFSGMFPHRVLIVDDVLTTGASMEKAKEGYPSGYDFQGFVLFARGKCPDWITPLFQMPEVQVPEVQE